MRTAWALVGTLISCAAFAADTVTVEKVRFEVTDAFERNAVVTGELRIPRSGVGKLAAVLILHGSAGIDGRGAFYAGALNEAGIASLEIDMFQGRGRPPTTLHNMPHAYQSLQLLANHPRIDARRIGVMGFSWGGLMSLVLSSDELTRRFGGGRHFAAHLGLYPVCWSQRAIVKGTPNFGPSTYAKVTGSPVHILAGDKDDYDDPDECQKFLAELPTDVRKHFGLTVYPGGTHMWDTIAGGSWFDGAARRGQGGTVQAIADPKLAAQSRRFAVEFFRRM